LKTHWKNITKFWSISSNNIFSSLEEKSWHELEDNILFISMKMKREKYFGVLKLW
jgi:hypothetical protein